MFSALTFVSTHNNSAFYKNIKYIQFKSILFTAVAVAQCLLVISEDNPVAWRVLNHFTQELIILLTVDQSQKSILLRTLSAAILSNVPALASAHINQIFSALTVALDVNHRDLLGKLTSSLPLEDNNKKQMELEVTDDHMEEETEQEASARRRRQDLPTEMDMQIKYVGWLLEAQRVAAETVTNLSTTEDDGKLISINLVNRIYIVFFVNLISDENNQADDDSSDAESVHDYDKDSSHSSNTNGIHNDKLPMEILEPIKSLGLVEKLWQRAQPIAENVTEILNATEKGLLKK